MRKVFNIDDEEVFSSDSDSDLIEFTKFITIDNEDFEVNPSSVSEAKEYLLEFCPDLVLIEVVLDCPICNCSLTEFIEESECIRECNGCGAEWGYDSGTITLDPKEL